MNLRYIESIGERETVGFVTRSDGRCRIEAIKTKIYPDSPGGETLRTYRISSQLSIGEVAKRLGLRPINISDLEHGRAEPVEGWEHLMKILLSESVKI